MITKLLYAEGINADYIDTGALTVKDKNGDIIFQVNMDTDTVYMNPDILIIGKQTLTEKLTAMDNSIAEAKSMTMQLTNDYQNITTDADGNIAGTFPTVTTTAQVMYGTNDVTNDCTYTVTKSNNVTGSWNDSTHTYTVTGLSADNGWVDIKATYLQVLSITKRFVVAKLKAGADGTPGRTYFVESSCTVLKRGTDKVISPNFLEFNAYYRDGDSATRYAYSGRFVIEETADGNTWKTIYTSSANETSVKHYLYTVLTDGNGQTITGGNGTTVGIPRDITNIRCKLYAAGGTTNMLDMQSVAVVIDVDNLTQTDIVNILSNNGAWKGLYYKNGQLYISFSAALGGELTLGGAHNGDGALILRNSSGEPIGTLDNDGLTFWDSYSEESTYYSYTGYRMTKEGIMRVEGSKSTNASVSDVELENSGVIDFGKIYKYGAEVLLQTEIITMNVPSFSSATTRSVSKKFSKLSDATTCVAIFQGVTGAGGKINIATYSVDEDTSTISAIFSNLSNENLGGTAIFQLLQYGYIGQ